jgi:hypothetical protein
VCNERTEATKRARRGAKRHVVLFTLTPRVGLDALVKKALSSGSHFFANYAYEQTVRAPASAFLV